MTMCISHRIRICTDVFVWRKLGAKRDSFRTNVQTMQQGVADLKVIAATVEIRLGTSVLGMRFM